MTKPIILTPIERVKEFATEKPWYFGGIVLAMILVLYFFLFVQGFTPEGERIPRMRAGKNVAVEGNDSMVWLGMRIVPVTRSLRHEFKLPGKVKGMFVLDEGKEMALKYKVKTGDIIVAINHKPVYNPVDFVKVADSVQQSGGILLDIYRDGESLYITIPFEYPYGPVFGPYKGSWQLGAPLAGQAFPYGRITVDNNTNTKTR